MAGSSPPRAVGTFSSLSPIDVQQAQKDKLFNKRLKDVEGENEVQKKRLRRQKRTMDTLVTTAISSAVTIAADNSLVRDMCFGGM